MNASPTGQMLGPPALDWDSFEKVTNSIGYTTPSPQYIKMIKPTFQQWAINTIFVIALEGGKRPSDMTHWTFTWQLALLIWFRMYGRIVYMAGDWSMDVMFKKNGII